MKISGGEEENFKGTPYRHFRCIIGAFTRIIYSLYIIYARSIQPLCKHMWLKYPAEIIRDVKIDTVATGQTR